MTKEWIAAVIAWLFVEYLPEQVLNALRAAHPGGSVGDGTLEPSIGALILGAIDEWNSTPGRPGLSTEALGQILSKGARHSPAREAIHTTILAGDLPSEAQWVEGFDELRRFLIEDLDRDPGRGLLALDEHDAAAQLEDLALIVHRRLASVPEVALPVLVRTLQRSKRRLHPESVVGRLLAAQTTVHEQRTPFGRYVRRLVAETAALDAIREQRPWVSIVGDAGTGKSTLLHRLLGTLLDDMRAGGGVVPLLADAQTLTGPLAESPLAELGFELGLRAASAWDSLLELGDLVWESERQLIVLLDTLDASLLADRGRARSLAWLRDDARRHHVQVVTACRPLEAAYYLPPGGRHDVRLHDYTLEEASIALESYLEAYYKDAPSVVRTSVEHVSRRYLQTSSIRPLCTRPITLRMIFDAHRGTHLPEKLDRAQLFRTYWESRVAGERLEQGTTYSRLSSPEDRTAFVLKIADRMRRNRRFYVSRLELEAAGRANAKATC